MKTNMFLIPANSNSGKLIFNIFTKFDLICVALVVPIPNYHNVYTVLKETVEFFYKRRNYKWEGWCTRDEFK